MEVLRALLGEVKSNKKSNITVETRRLKAE